MGGLGEDIRYALRRLGKGTGLTAAAVLSLALGIGANTTIFTFLKAVFWRPVPVDRPEELVAVFTVDSQFPGMLPTSYPNFRDLKEGPGLQEGNRGVFSGLVASLAIQASLSGDGEPEKLEGALVSGDFFDVLGARPQLGRGFLPEEDGAPGGHAVVVVGDGLWRRRFAADPHLVGRSLTLNNQPFTVIGIAPPGFAGAQALSKAEIFVPLAMHDQMLFGIPRQWFEVRGALLLSLVGRRAPGVSLEQAQAALDTIARRLETAFPDDNEARSYKLLPYLAATIDPNQRDSYVKAGAVLATVVGLVLLIACSNIANLLLARAAARRREIAVRLALGVTRARLVRQLLVESVCLGLLGGIAGLGLAFVGRRLLWALRPPNIPETLDIRFDLPVLAFTLGLAVLTGLLFGLAPALKSSRLSLVAALKSGAASTGKPSRLPLGQALVAFQVALSMVALLGAGLFLSSLAHVQRIDPGFAADELAVLTYDLGPRRLSETDGRDLHRRVLEQARRLPGVRGAALGQNLVFVTTALLTPIEIEGREDSDEPIYIQSQSVSPGYFETLGIPLRAGRGFADTDRPDGQPVAIVNETMAKRFWPDASSLGKRFTLAGSERPVEIVGVAADAKYNTIGEDPKLYAYLPVTQVYAPEMTLHLRGSDLAGTRRAGPLLAAARSEIARLDPNLPLYNVEPMSAILARSLWAPRIGAVLLGLFGGVALVLVAVGVYGVMSYSVSQRNRELGIRVAIGADRRSVLGLVLRQALVLVGLGLAAGLALALTSTHAVASLLYGVSPLDPLILVATIAVLLAVAFLASYLPARRATRVDPILVLRDE